MTALLEACTTNTPTIYPTIAPTYQPTSYPTEQPTSTPSGYPSFQPTGQPTTQPSACPTLQPSTVPSSLPSCQPSFRPSAQPSMQPLSWPSSQPTMYPTFHPTTMPSMQPITRPSSQPTIQPSKQPSVQPTMIPSVQPSSRPTMQPSIQPSEKPTAQPSIRPSPQPSSRPSNQPTSCPSEQPSQQPSMRPSSQPTRVPSRMPTSHPTMQPSNKPSARPSMQPISLPSMQPSAQPSKQPNVQPSTVPSIQPISRPSMQPSTQPSIFPSDQPTSRPSKQPSAQPSVQPSMWPSMRPSDQPTTLPSVQPSEQPSIRPSCQPSSRPSMQPSIQPSDLPTSRPSGQPSLQPSTQPTERPSRRPSRRPSSHPSMQPSTQPSTKPSVQPSMRPTSQPSSRPSMQPGAMPSTQPSEHPTSRPSMQPSIQPSYFPTSHPSVQPSSQPSARPSMQPSVLPSSQPTAQPSMRPSAQPTARPSSHPTILPSSQPSVQPSMLPTSCPSSQPSQQPSMRPSAQPTRVPSGKPTSRPSMQPSKQPSMRPSRKPTLQPSMQPSSQPSMKPTEQPSIQPSCLPTSQPSTQPSDQPTSLPSMQPSTQPSEQPSSRPSLHPSSRPTTQPSKQPSVQPSSRPSRRPTQCPSRHPSSQPSRDPSSQPSTHPSIHPTSRPSRQPSVQPSNQPSRVPIAHPSTHPSSHPSSQPSRQPNEQPSSRPTLRPSSRPSLQPSNQPSVQPSSQPSRRPTLRPSRQPSSRPSNQPSKQPSSQPSRQPSNHPSAQPSRQPLSHPSQQPSSCPSMQPSTQPTTNPTTSMPTTAAPTPLITMKPSYKPTSSPSYAPSKSPTCVPSSAPSLAPSSLPSIKPTLVPTSAPTLSEASLLTIKLQNYLSSNLTTSDSSATVLYQEVVARGTLPSVGGCNNWKVSTGSSLSVSLLTQVATSLSMFNYNDNRLVVRLIVSCFHHSVSFPPLIVVYFLFFFSNVGKTVQCNTATAATNIINAIANAGTIMTNVTCAGHTWRIQRCKGTRTSLCVDCANPCVITPTTCSTLQMFNPCGGVSGTDGGGAGYGCSTTQSSVNMFRVLYGTFQLNPAFVPPIISTLTIVANKTTAVVNAVLSDDGTLYCGAFFTTTVPSSISQITSQKFVAASVSGTAHISITGLLPATSYAVYCISQSSLGTLASFATALTSKHTMTTLCCKTITVTINVDSMYEESSASNAIQITMDAPPSQDLLIVLSANDGVAVSSLIPGNFSLTSTSALIPLYASVGAATTVNTGIVNVITTLSGASASEYHIVYSQGQSFSVLLHVQPLPPPTLSSVSFSADGTALVASLSADSDLAGITRSHFPCSQLFSFTAASGLNATKCSWSDPSDIHITLDSSAALNVGDSVTLRGGNIRAACPVNATHTKCAKWSTTPRTATVVLAPVSPVIPTVAISAPSIIGMCDAFPIDVSSSVGSCGRVWSNISFSIKSTNSSGMAKALHFLNKQYAFSPPSSVPAGYFATGISQITVKMCNFLGACGTASIQLAVTGKNAPVVTIGGDQSFSTTVAAGLSINGDGYVSICNFTAKGVALPAVSRAGLTFQWAAYVAGTQDFSLVSYSKQYYSYKLAPYSLIAGTTYTFTLTVIDGSTSLSSTRSVQVIVVPSAVVAVISQGSKATVYQGSNITLSAATSYDMDKFGMTGAAAGLSFKWSCAQTLPVISTACSFTRPSGSNTQSLVVVAASTLAVGTTSVLTVYVTSAGRTSTTSITVSVVSNDRPLVSVSSSTIVGKVAPDHQLAMSGKAFTTTGGYASWAVSDSSLNLTSLALTPSQNVVVGSGLSTMTLVLPPNTLSPGSTLTFTLSCRSATTGFSSSASLSVVVNSPPQGGVFVVSPLNGRELTDTFTFSASRWWDTDLPINYAFGFASPSSRTLNVVQALSQQLFTITSLPAGQDTSNYTLACQMLVYDSYLSSAAATQSVYVKPSQVSNDDLQKEVSKKLSDPAAATQILSVAVAMVTNVQCISAPNCTKLHRLPCSAKKNTCGVCVSPKLVGENSESNGQCMTPEAAASLYGSSSKGDHRLLTTTAPSKTCLSSCSGVGTCGFVSVNTFAAVSTCVITDPYCTAVCTCNSGYYGPSCALSLADLQSQQSFRSLLLSGFYNSTTSTDATADTVTAWTAQVVSLTRSYETLTPASMNIAVELLQAIVINADHLQLPSAVVVGVLGACDALAQAVLLNNPTTASSHTLGPVVQQLMGLMEKYVSLALGQMNAMQYDSTLTSYQTFKNINCVKSVITDSSGSRSVAVSVPSTATESLANTPQTTIVFNNIPSGTKDMKIGLVETKAHLFNATQTPHSRRLSTSNSWQSSSAVTSNLVKVVLPDVTVCGDSDTCSVTVTLPTITSETYANGAATATVFTTTCNIGQPQTVINTCPDGSTLSTVCSGASPAYTYTQTCPWLVVAPTCGRVVAGSSSTLNVVTDVCTTVSFTTTSATCSCSLSTNTLLTDSSGSSNAGSVQLASVTTTSQLTAAAVQVFLSGAPTYRPSPIPTSVPTNIPISSIPTNEPTTLIPSTTPTVYGWLSPTREPTTFKPTYYPTYSPTCKPTQEPTTAIPSYSPTFRSTQEPTTSSPTFLPTPEPTHPTYTPTIEPTHPTYSPTAVPSTVSPTITPSMEPSLNPSFAPVAIDAPVVTVQATQTVAGVTSDSADFRTAFASAVMSLLPTGSSVTIVSVTVINVRHRQLLTTAVSVVYTVQSTAPATTLTTLLASGTAAMTTVLQQSYPAASVAAPTIVTITNPTAAPTTVPAASTNAASGSSSSSANSWVAVGAGIGGGVLLLLVVAGIVWHRKRVAKKNQTIAIQSPADNGNMSEVANLHQTVKPTGNQLYAASVPYIVEPFIPMEPELLNSSSNGNMGSDDDQVVTSTVQQKPSNQPTLSTHTNNVSMVHIEEHHVIDIPLERDGSVLMVQDMTMWDDEPREVDIETPVESRRVSPQGSRVPSHASSRAPTPLRSRNISPALSLAPSPVASIPNSPRNRPNTNRFLPTNPPTDAVLSSFAENSINGTTEFPPHFLSNNVPMVSRRTLLPPLATPTHSILPSVTSPLPLSTTKRTPLPRKNDEDHL